jgi:hypothetical protein
LEKEKHFTVSGKSNNKGCMKIVRPEGVPVIKMENRK